MEKDWQDQEGRVEWLDSERLVDDYFVVDKIRLRHEMLSGEMSPEIERYLLRRPDAVAAVVVNTDRDLMYFVRQFRMGPATKEDPAWMIELAAGLIDKGEKPDDAIVREVREELGFNASDTRQISKIYPSSAIISERIYVYYVEVTDEERISGGGGVEGEHEDLDILEVPLNRLREFVMTAGITDAKTLVGLGWFLNGKKWP